MRPDLQHDDTFLLGRLIESRRTRRGSGFVRFLPVAVGIHGLVLGTILLNEDRRAPAREPPPVRVTFAPPAPAPPPPAPAAPRAAPKAPRPEPPAAKPAPVVEPVVVPDSLEIPDATQELDERDEAMSEDISGGAPGSPAGVVGGVPGGTGDSPPRGPLRVTGDISPPQLIDQVEPDYPRLARQNRIEGEVILEAVIRRDGSVGEVRVIQGLRLGCTEAAVAALKRWRFTPAMQYGEPVDVLVGLKVIFRLE